MRGTKQRAGWSAEVSRRTRRALAVVGAGAVALVAVPAAHADVVYNSVAVGGTTSVEAGKVATIGYWIQNRNTNPNQDPAYVDTQSSCNPADQTPATLTVDAPDDVSVTPAAQTYSGCELTKYFGFSSTVPGTYVVTVSVSDLGTGTYVTSDATFTLTVTPPSNTAPSVAVTGVTAGAEYEYDDVPAAGCSVTDAQDGARSFAATLSAITGSRSADGLGSQTASCSYTDAGGLRGTASITYSIVDTTAPVVTATAPAPVEATGPLTPVTFTASALDAVDGSVAVACATAGGTSYASGDRFPVGTTMLTCSATDEAGNTGSVDPIAVVVRDTTAPGLALPSDIALTATSASGAVASFSTSATDLVDGAVDVTCNRTSGSTFALAATTVTCSATDAAGNTATGSFKVTVTLGWSGVLQPINRDGSSLFKAGSTVPVKFQLTGASAGITTLAARLYVKQTGGSVTGTEVEAISTVTGTDGTLFRYDAASGQYVFNLSTKGMTKGTYQLRVDLGDGVEHTVSISLK